MLTHLTIGGGGATLLTATRCDCVSCGIEDRPSARTSVPTAQYQDALSPNATVFRRDTGLKNLCEF